MLRSMKLTSAGVGMASAGVALKVKLPLSALSSAGAMLKLLSSPMSRAKPFCRLLKIWLKKALRFTRMSFKSRIALPERDTNTSASIMVRRSTFRAIHTRTALRVFRAQVKNAVNGVHHGVSPDYLQDYVNEYSFRYSHRNDVQPMFWTIMDRVAVGGQP